MSASEWVVVAAASWTILAFVVAVPIGRAMRDEEPETVNWIPVLPPVPAPVKPCEYDDAWLTVWPTDVERSDIDVLEQRVYDRLFDDLIAIEGLS